MRGAGEKQAGEGRALDQHGISARQPNQTFCYRPAAVCAAWSNLRGAEGTPVLPGEEETLQSSGGIPWPPQTLALWPQSPGKEWAGLRVGLPQLCKVSVRTIKNGCGGCVPCSCLFLQERTSAQRMPRLLQGRRKWCWIHVMHHLAKKSRALFNHVLKKRVMGLPWSYLNMSNHKISVCYIKPSTNRSVLPYGC